MIRLISTTRLDMNKIEEETCLKKKNILEQNEKHLWLQI